MRFIELTGFISGISYSPQFNDEKKIDSYSFENYDVNDSKSIGIIHFAENNFVYYTKWTTPKRTRSYPFERLYSVFNANCKIITIIPILKDEGNDSANNDRINAITYSWMNLLNVYIVLAYYETAEKLPLEKRKIAKNKVKNSKPKTQLITNQKFNNSYIKSKIEEIGTYKASALHWNTFHFKRDLEIVWKRAVDCYKDISMIQKVKLHSFENHLKVLDKFMIEGKFSIEKFKDIMNMRSKMAQNREVLTLHKLEALDNDVKGKFFIKNYLGGIYYLTCDGILIEKGVLIVQESKNTTTKKIPQISDIKDGLFKLILFSNLEYIVYNGKKVKFQSRLRLTGDVLGQIAFPAKKDEIEIFIKKNKFSKNDKKIIENLNKEAIKNNISIQISGNQSDVK